MPRPRMTNRSSSRYPSTLAGVGIIEYMVGFRLTGLGSYVVIRSELNPGTWCGLTVPEVIVNTANASLSASLRGLLAQA
jgi:hypothetical protein